MRLKKEYHKLSPDQRLYHFDKPIIGLTGGIATGKSTVSKILKNKGFQIIDADQLVKDIYETKEAHKFIQSSFPGAYTEDEIDFKQLRSLVFGNSKVKSQVENFIYQRLPNAIKEASKKIKDQDFYIYEVPLLFERNLDKSVDVKIVVYAPRRIQLERIISRDGSSKEVSESILDQQMDIEEKKQKADFVINNSGKPSELLKEVELLINDLIA